MESRPLALAEAIVGALIPPACRESVLGDLSECYTTLPRYLRDAAGIVPRVVVGLAWRSLRVDLDLAWTEAALLLVVFGGPASDYWRRGGRPWLSALVALIVLLLCDAYADPNRRGPQEPVREASRKEAVRSVRNVALRLGDSARGGRDVVLALLAAWLLARATIVADVVGVTSILILADLRVQWRTLFASGSARLREADRVSTTPLLFTVALFPMWMMAMRQAGDGIGRAAAYGSIVLVAYAAVSGLITLREALAGPRLSRTFAALAPLWEWLAIVPLLLELAYEHQRADWLAPVAAMALFGTLRSARRRASAERGMTPRP